MRLKLKRKTRKKFLQIFRVKKKREKNFLRSCDVMTFPSNVVIIFNDLFAFTLHVIVFPPPLIVNITMDSRFCCCSHHSFNSSEIYFCHSSFVVMTACRVLVVCGKSSRKDFSCHSWQTIFFFSFFLFLSTYERMWMRMTKEEEESFSSAKIDFIQ